MTKSVQKSVQSCMYNKGQRVYIKKKKLLKKPQKKRVRAPVIHEKEGCPTAYRPEYNAQVYKLCLLRVTDEQLAGCLGVCYMTVKNWKKSEPEFLSAMTKGKKIADAEVAQSLYNRAKGCSHPEEHLVNVGGKMQIKKTTKYHPPDTAAAFIWLKNRQGKNWKDTPVIQLEQHQHYSDIKIDGKDTIDITDMLLRRYAEKKQIDNREDTLSNSKEV